VSHQRPDHGLPVERIGVLENVAGAPDHVDVDDGPTPSLPTFRQRSAAQRHATSRSSELHYQALTRVQFAGRRRAKRPLANAPLGRLDLKDAAESAGVSYRRGQ
jgi:hypothetical protein